MDMRALKSRGTDAPWYQARVLTDEARAVFRATTMASSAAKRLALRGEAESRHPVNVPELDPASLMPRRPRNGLRTLSMFSGGGGMDIGFDRAGFEHIANYEIMTGAADVLRAAHPSWSVYGGSAAGDVTGVKWSAYKGLVDVIHGGPPCQPFSHAGRRAGANDVRDMIPAMVATILVVRPEAFILENVSGLLTKRFEGYVRTTILAPLERAYRVKILRLEAPDYGVPQRRRRVFFVGFRDPKCATAFVSPEPTHSTDALADLPVKKGLRQTMGVRRALGLPDIGFDTLAPTIRSGLTGPRHTTSVLNSVTALKVWNDLHIWPNGVAETRQRASAYPAKHGHFRMSVPDCLVIQGFPARWPITPPVYFALGLIGNAVAPPMAYAVARAVQAALSQAKP